MLMHLYYVLFLAHVAYLLTIARPYYHTIKTGRFNKFMTEAPLILLIDLIVSVTFLVTAAMFVSACLDLNPGHLPLVLISVILYVMSVIRDQVARAIRPEIDKGEAA